MNSFHGRQYLSGTGNNPSIQPITITSQVAEIIYFLRNGNLYRRVLLVAPERAREISLAENSGREAMLGHASQVS